MHRVFVYGTLKTDQPNHHVISKGIQAGDCQFDGLGVTEAKYSLVIASQYNIPFLLDARNVVNSQNVEGEVYSVNEKMLSLLDGFERHPQFYTRCEVPILIKDKTEKMWCYLMQNFREHLLQLPTTPNYDSALHAPYLGGKERPDREEDRRAFMLEIKENI
ncbi:putative gamma-glutamylcyclotransferase CG2811 isoform X2 [Ostrea edulis]|uniref:putative gamma-glutamylcyclotransferase CG2811 isoform X2 n=1 Tax=Ostrea edulis TaxID=37623 RepID=UPI0020964684|nr:putative gamma-glutamylcyclotransferase CG2811 isoform X2 [Ostrea edulis]